jgi:hypothetical protein
MLRINFKKYMRFLMLTITYIIIKQFIFNPLFTKAFIILSKFNKLKTLGAFNQN